MLSIPYHDGAFLKTEQEAVDAAHQARGHQVEALLKQIEILPDKDLPIFVVGDFNEPSHLDWTPEAAELGRHPINVSWPASLELTKAGFVDAYRVAHPDEINNPGYTWTPLTEVNDTNDHHDRIDFIYVKGENVKVEKVEMAGESEEHANIVVTPYPSDHRAVVATFALP